MTISLDRLILHMAWANQKVISHLETLPEESLRAFTVNEEWDVAEILNHLVGSAEYYLYRIRDNLDSIAFISSITGKIQSINELREFKELISRVDAALLECVKLDDKKLELVNSSGTLVSRWRSTILSLKRFIMRQNIEPKSLAR